MEWDARRIGSRRAVPMRCLAGVWSFRCPRPRTENAGSCDVHHTCRRHLGTTINASRYLRWSVGCSSPDTSSVCSRKNVSRVPLRLRRKNGEDTTSPWLRCGTALLPSKTVTTLNALLTQLSDATFQADESFRRRSQRRLITPETSLSDIAAANCDVRLNPPPNSRHQSGHALRSALPVHDRPLDCG